MWKGLIAPTRTSATTGLARASCNCLAVICFQARSCRQHQLSASGFLKIFTASVCHSLSPLFVVLVYHEAWIFAQFSVRQGWTTEPVVDSVARMFLKVKYLSGEIRANVLNFTSLNKYWKFRNPGTASCKEIQIQESGKFLLVESGIRILDSGIWNTAQVIRNPSNDWNPESKSHWQRNRNSVPGIQNPRLSWIPLRGATGTFSSVTFKLLIEKSFCNLRWLLKITIFRHKQPTSTRS